MGMGLVDAVVAGQRRQFAVGQAQAQEVGQLHGAQQRVDGKLHAGPTGFGGQKPVVEIGVVGDQRAAAQHPGQISADVVELWGAGQRRRG